MALYEFECDTPKTCSPVGRRVELRLPMADAGKPQACPACGAPMRRVWSAVPFRFGFWYGYHGNVGTGFDSQEQRDRHYEENNLVRLEPEQVHAAGSAGGTA